MELINISSFIYENAIKDDSVVILDKINPIGFRVINDSVLTFLFEGFQSCTEEYYYIAANIIESIEDNSFYINYIKASLFNIENGMEILTDEMRERCSGSNLHSKIIYQADFSGELSGKYFKIKAIDKKANMYKTFLIHKQSYIKLKSFIDRFCKYDVTSGVEYFTNIIDKADIIKPVDIHLDATTISAKQNAILNHYKIKSGPYEYKFHYASPIHPKLPKSSLQNQLTEDVYDTFYSKDPFIFNAIYEPNEDKMYLIYIKDSIIVGGEAKCYIFELDRPLILKTNLLYPYKNYRNS
jgi:GH43 family beta-xylosidase